MKAIIQTYEFDVPGPLKGSWEQPTVSNINIKSLFLRSEIPFHYCIFSKEIEQRNVAFKENISLLL